METFVTFEIGKKLKEKGFILNYNLYGYKPIYTDTNTIALIWNIGAYEKDYFGENIPCPTISHVLKWLRDYHNIHISIDVTEFDDESWMWSIYDIETGDIRPYDGLASTYEKAVMNGIEYVINNLI